MEFCYRNFEVVAFDETHGVIRSTVGVSAKTHNRDKLGCSKPPVTSASSTNRELESLGILRLNFLKATLRIHIPHR